VIISTILIYAQIEFSYSGSTGPAFWDRLEGSDKICRLGKNQSPIDITQEEIKIFSKPDEVIFKDARNVEITNDGHSVQVNTNEATMKIGNDHYELEQFHFHTPSEHRVNGKYHDVEAHFVFQTKEGKLSVIGVFYDVADQQSNFFKPIITNVMKIYFL